MLIFPRLTPLLVGAALLSSNLVNSRAHDSRPDYYEGIQQTVMETEDQSVNKIWTDATGLGDRLKVYAKHTLDDLASKYAINEKVASVRSFIHDLVGDTENALKDIAANLPMGIHVSKITDELHDRLVNMTIPEKLKEQFPPPDQAPSHEERERLVGAIYGLFIDEVGSVLDKVGSSEREKGKVKDSLTRLQPTLTKIAVATGDLAEQHPAILEALVIALTFEIAPVLFLRPFLRLVGFGPLGPVKGSLAAWTQRRLFGAAIPAGSWFSFLQRAGMVSRSWLGSLFGSIGGLFDGLSGWFKFDGLTGWFKSIFGF